MRVTDKDVWKAADEVLQAGERPTIERIRTRLGRGSPNTVNEHLNQWYVQLSSRIRDLESFTPASGIPEPVGQAARHFWEVAQSVAREECAAALSDERASLSEDQRRLAEAQADLEARERGFEARASALEDALSLTRGQLDAGTLRLAALELTIAGLQGEIVEARQLELRLRSDIADRQAQLEAERTNAEERRAIFDERLDEVTRRAARETDLAREQNKSLNVDLDRLRAELVTQQRAQVESMRRQTEAEEQSETTRRELIEVRRSHADTTTQLEAQRASNLQLHIALAEAQELLKTKDSEHGELLKTLVARTTLTTTRSARRVKGRSTTDAK